MERELLEVFELAKKAADAASTPGGSSVVDGPAVSRCVDALKRLKGFPVSYDALVATQVGKRLLRYLTKHPSESVKILASGVLEVWKKIVIEEATQHKKNSVQDDKISPKMERANSIKIEKGSKACINKVDSNLRAEKVKAEEMRNGGVKRCVASKLDHVKDERNSVDGYSAVSEEAVKVEQSPKEEERDSSVKQSSHMSITPPKLTATVKCNDPLRDKIRELLAEALAKVATEADEDFRDEVNACDPIRFAATVESMMFEKMGRSNGTQKVKYRSIMFNLKDADNPDLRRKVLLGQVKPDRLITMTPEEMASDQRQRENNQIKEKALFECERGGPPKATTDQFKCGRCGQHKTTYYQLQTRSADEPMTTFVTCVTCNNRWKFC